MKTNYRLILSELLGTGTTIDRIAAKAKCQPFALKQVLNGNAPSPTLSERLIALHDRVKN